MSKLYVKQTSTPSKSRNKDYQLSNTTSSTISSGGGGGGVSAFSQLTDTSINDVVNGQFAYYNGSDWVNTSLIKVVSNQITINDLTTTNITTTNLTSTNGTITTLNSTTGTITTLTAPTITTTNLTASSKITTDDLIVNNDLTTDDLTSSTGIITTLSSNYIDTVSLISGSATINTLTAPTINTTNLTASSKITTNNLVATNGTITALTSTTGTINDLSSTTIDAGTITATTLNSDELNTLTINCTDINIDGNLNIKGEINNINGVVTNIDDAWILLNSGNNAVNSGIQVQINTGGSVSKLFRNSVNGLWYIDDKQILTGADVLNTKLTGFVPNNTPITATQNILQGFNSTQGQINNRPQYNVNESILNKWTFTNGLDSSADVNVTTKLSAGYIGVNKTDSASGRGISLWNSYEESMLNSPNYGFFFGQTSTFGSHGIINNYATYFTSNSIAGHTGWVFKDNNNNTNIASIDIIGNSSFNGDIEAGANISSGVSLRKEGGIEIYHNSTPYIDFHYGNSLVDYTTRIIETQAGYLTIDSTATSFSNTIGGTQPFSSGFAGQGWRLQNNSLEVDNLTVRGAMNVYELVVNQVKATNGDLYVSDSYKATYLTKGGLYDLYGDDDNGRLRMPFQEGDIVTSQTFDGKNVVKIVGIVQRYSGYTANMFGLRIPLVEGELIQGQSYSWVRTGNVIDTNRQGAIYLTSSANNSPYIDIVDGSNGVTTNTPRRIRYIRDWTKGSDLNGSNITSEIKALSNGVNMAYNKAVTSNFYLVNAQSVVDDSTNTYCYSDSDWKSVYVQVDLGSLHDIDEIKIWHSTDNRSFYGTKTEVSSDGITWYTLFNSDLFGTYQESPEGRTYKLGANKTKARLGRLDGIIDSDYGLLGGYGLYAENVYLKGGIMASFGKIGAFHLDSEWLKFGNQAYMNGEYGNSANGLMIGKASTNDYPGLYVQWSGNNDGILGNVSVGKIVKHGYETTNRLGINFQHANNTIFEMSRNTSTGAINCEIAGWNFNNKGIYKNEENYLISLGNSTSGDIYTEGKRGLTIRYIKTGITDGYCELMALGQIPLRQWSLKEDGISSYDGLTEYDTGTYGLLVRANNNEVIRLDGTSNSHLNGIQVPRGGGLHDNGVLFGGYGIGVSTSNDSYSGDWYRFKVFNSENYETRSGYNTGGIAALNTNIRNYLFNGQDVDGMIMMSKHHLRNNQVWQQQSPIVTAKHYNGEQYVFLGGAVTCAGRRTPTGGSSSISAKEVELFDCFKVNSNLTLPPETEMRPYLVFEGKQITLVNTTANNINISGIRNSITTTTGVKTIPPFKTAIFTFVNNSWYSEQ